MSYLLSYSLRSIHHNHQARNWRHRAIRRAVCQMNPPFVMHIVLYQPNPRETNVLHHHILNYLFIILFIYLFIQPVHLWNWKNPQHQDGSVYLSSSKNNKFLSFMDAHWGVNQKICWTVIFIYWNQYLKKSLNFWRKLSSILTLFDVFDLLSDQIPINANFSW